MRRASFINRCASRRSWRRARQARKLFRRVMLGEQRREPGYSQKGDWSYILPMAKAKKRGSAAKRKRLPEYEAKRHFGVTPEPAPGAVEPSAVPTYMIHKHHATRLHYDLRLEMDDALASWAVPKGPSYDPDVKRLA